jgi:hypothetical protein
VKKCDISLQAKVLIAESVARNRAATLAKATWRMMRAARAYKATRAKFVKLDAVLRAYIAYRRCARRLSAESDDLLRRLRSGLVLKKFSHSSVAGGLGGKKVVAKSLTVSLVSGDGNSVGDAGDLPKVGSIDRARRVAPKNASSLSTPRANNGRNCPPDDLLLHSERTNKKDAMMI